MIFTIIILPSEANDRIKVNAKMETEFSLNENTPTTIKFIPGKTVKIGQETTIKPDSIVTAEVYQAGKENCWYKADKQLAKTARKQKKARAKIFREERTKL